MYISQAIHLRRSQSKTTASPLRSTKRLNRVPGHRALSGAQMLLSVISLNWNLTRKILQKSTLKVALLSHSLPSAITEFELQRLSDRKNDSERMMLNPAINSTCPMTTSTRCRKRVAVIVYARRLDNLSSSMPIPLRSSNFPLCVKRIAVLTGPLIF